MVRLLLLLGRLFYGLLRCCFLLCHENSTPLRCQNVDRCVCGISEFVQRVNFFCQQVAGKVCRHAGPSLVLMCRSTEKLSRRILKKAVQQGPSNSPYVSSREWPRPPFTPRIGRAQFHRARSASKKGTWPLPHSFFAPINRQPINARRFQ